MQNKNKHPELNQEEIDAIREEMEKHSTNIDRFFLLKLHTILVLCLYFSSLMLIFPNSITFWLQINQGTSPDRLDNILIYRGVFVLTYMLAAIISWKKDRYTELVFGSATIMASANFLLDLPYLVSADFSTDAAGLVFGILIRVLIIALLVSVFRNLHRASYLQGKLFINPFAPLKQ